MELATPHQNDGSTDSEPGGAGALRRLAGFVIFALCVIALTFFLPVREFFSVENISGLADRLGYLGPVLIVLIGTVAPLLFIPRWPISFVSGLLYGVFWGALLGTLASTLGAWLHYTMARGLLAPASKRAMKKLSFSMADIPRDELFWPLLFVRAFPLSNFIATNLVAGAIRVPLRLYLVTAFVGMLPSSVMYAVYGKLMKEPSSGLYTVAMLTLFVVVGGLLVARKWLFPWLKSRAGREGRHSAGETPSTASPDRALDHNTPPN